jgi:hypothetical protein
VKVEAKWYLTIKKERPLPSSLSTPPREEDRTMETLGNMMARLKILVEVREKNKALVQELKEIREERKSECVLEKPSVFPDDPFSPIEPVHKRIPRKAKHGHGTRAFPRSLRGGFEEEEYYVPRRGHRASTGRAGHVKQRTMQEDPHFRGGEFSFLMKEDLEGIEVDGVGSTSPFMTTSVPNVSQRGTPLQKPLVREQLEECLENDAQPFGHNTWMQSPQPTVPAHHFVHTLQMNTQIHVNIPTSQGDVTLGGFAFPMTIGSMPPSPGLKFTRGASFVDRSVKYVCLYCELTLQCLL